MLGEYFQGTLPQFIERARLLKGKIPRGLPRDYEALIKACEYELGDIIARFRELQGGHSISSSRLSHTHLRQFRRAVADLDHVETTAITALNRAQDDDHHANRLLYRICHEIGYPISTPTVTTLSSGYFYIDTKLNLMFIPPAEGNFLLHLPDLYHELGHPLLTHEDHPVLDRLRTRYLKCIAEVHDHFSSESAKQNLRHGPRSFAEQLDVWELLWSKYWLTEFFCDLFAVATLGPAFAWSHLHLYLKAGGNAFAMPDGLRNITHPADDARMCCMLEALRRAGFSSDAARIGARWKEALDLSGDMASPEYMHCYPDNLLRLIVENVSLGAREMDCRIADQGTTDPIYVMLNEAWRKFWDAPAAYKDWESNAVKTLFLLCEK